MRTTLGIESRGGNTLANVAALALAMGRGLHARVGVVDDGKGAEASDDRDGPSNADIAAWNEFGTEDVPERSFMRSTLAAKRQEWVALLGQLCRRVITGKLSVEQAFNQLGAKAAADIKFTITGGAPIDPPNSPAVAARKAALGKKGGVVRTLVDTGALVASISWRLVTGR